MFYYINKVSLIFFVGIAAFFLWELINFLKEYRKRKIGLPGFSEKEYQKKTLLQSTSLKIKEKTIKKANLKLAFLGIGTFLIVIGFSFISLTSTQRSSAQEEKEPIIKRIFSEGIVIFDKDWNLIEDVNKLKPGDKIFIGIYKPAIDEIDKARIRVNEYSWKSEHITDKFNEEKGVFYIEYKNPSEAAKLLIEAQLHSKTKGWLTE